MLTEAGEDVIGVDLAGADIAADLATVAGRAAAVAGVRERCEGVLDAIVTCAGTANPELPLVGVNYFGTAALVEGLRDALAAAPNPRVGVVASITGTHSFDSRLVESCLAGDEGAAVERCAELAGEGDNWTLYPSSKVAVARWLRRTCVTAGWADAGIAMNAVAPGVVLTPMTAPLLADERTTHITGQVLYVDGGAEATLRGPEAY